MRLGEKKQTLLLFQSDLDQAERAFRRRPYPGPPLLELRLGFLSRWGLDSTLISSKPLLLLLPLSLLLFLPGADSQAPQTPTLRAAVQTCPRSRALGRAHVQRADGHPRIWTRTRSPHAPDTRGPTPARAPGLARALPPRPRQALTVC